MCLRSDVCTHLHPDTRVHACKKTYKQVCTYTNKARCQTHALELIANNGCQLGSRCSRQHNWAQADCFFNWVGVVGEKGKKWQTCE